jgi:uncharacterized protein (DUF2236 family)
MFHIQLSGEKPEPKPYYYTRMNPEELFVWEIIVSIRHQLHVFHLLELKTNYAQGEQKYEWVRTRKGKLRKVRLSPKERAARQRMFYDHRVGHGVCGDDWMRKQIPCRKAP